MRDGIYEVTTKYLCAGFVIRDGKLAECAPILRRKFPYWQQRAKWICSELPKITGDEKAPDGPRISERSGPSDSRQAPG